MDKEFVRYYLSIPADLKMFDGVDRLEKYLLRKAFDDTNLVPNNVLWRRKCAFSDGVSSKKNSWHRILQNFVDSQITDTEFETKINTYKN